MEADEKEDRQRYYEEFLRNPWGQDMKEAFDAQKLRTLADKPSRTRSERKKMMALILHAAFKKAPGFQDLLERPELREERGFDMALSGYDYAVNNSEAALNSILAQLATEDIGADVGTIVVLSVLDEWDRTIRAFRKHFVHTDGAGGTCKASFMGTRAYLYPKKYAEMRAAIEAPIEWTLPLLPKKRDPLEKAPKMVRQVIVVYMRDRVPRGVVEAVHEVEWRGAPAYTVDMRTEKGERISLTLTPPGKILKDVVRP